MLLADDFTDNVLSPTTWSVASLFSGTDDPSIAVTETGQQLRIGPLLASTSGSHYNGVASVAAYDVTGAAAHVELVQPASAGATAYAMLTAGSTAATTTGSSSPARRWSRSSGSRG